MTYAEVRQGPSTPPGLRKRRVALATETHSRTSMPSFHLAWELFASKVLPRDSQNAAVKRIPAQRAKLVSNTAVER